MDFHPKHSQNRVKNNKSGGFLICVWVYSLVVDDGDVECELSWSRFCSLNNLVADLSGSTEVK